MLETDFLCPDAMPIRLAQTRFLLMYGASRQTLEVGGGVITSRLAAADKQGIERAFGTTMNTGETDMLQTKAFPI